MEKKVHNVEWLTKAGPYSHAVEAGGFVFVSGQGPVDKDKGKLIKDDVKAATELTLANVKKLLEACGSGMDKVVKVTVFLTDMDDFGAMNEVYKTFFTSAEPARSCVAVKALPMGIPVEIEAVAIK